MKKHIFRRILLLGLACLMVLPCFTAVEIPAEGGSGELSSGSYRIKNLSTGLYLGASVYYSRNKTATLRIYSGPLNEKDDGQVFVLTEDENGCFTMVPKNDSGLYYVSCESGTEAGSRITKTKTNGTSCLFDITKVGENYTIAPSYGDNLKAVVAPGTEYSGKNYYCEIQDYVRGDASQLWVLEPINATGISVAYYRTTVKLYTTGNFYAALRPSGAAADAVWTSDNEDVLMIGDDGVYTALKTGSAKVTASCDGYSASFTVTVTDKTCFTWFSQNSTTASDWNGSLLTSLYFYDYSTNKKLRFIWDQTSSYKYDNWMDTGCAICAVAEVLHNMNAKMAVGYDLRTAQSGNLDADPYTVSLANTKNTEIMSTTSLAYGNPTYVAWKYVADAFFADGEAVAYRKIYYPTRRIIQQCIENHPQGVIVEFSKSDGSSHYMVFSECVNPTEKYSSKLEFRVYDPAAYYESNGKNVLFTDSISYKSYKYSHISGVIIYDTVSNVDK